MTARSVREGVLDSLPIAAGYFPIAFSFGVSAVQAGISPLIGVLISAVVFAGGSQFVLLGLLSSGAALPAVVATTLLMNARHLLYGRRIAQSLPVSHASPPKPLLAFGLTDEVFACAIGRLHDLAETERAHWLFGLQCGAYLAWVAGTILGILTGAQIVDRFPILRDALGFVLPALFLSLLLNLDWRDSRVSVLIAAIVTLVLTFFVPVHLAILAGIVSGICGAALPGRGNA